MKKTMTAALCLLAAIPVLAGNVKGRVTSSGEPVEGVQISDGTVIVTTDAHGRYDMESDKSSGMVFITTPSGYHAASSDGIRPGFWQYLVLDKDQDEIHDFNLIPQNQKCYTVLFSTDMHLVNDPRRQDLRRFKEKVLPVVKQLTDEASAKGPVYSFNLGDFTHDIYWYEFGFNESDGIRFLQDCGWPSLMYGATGNHDHDGAITGDDVDWRAGWRARDVWGPDCYSVNIGGDHWIFLDDIVYENIAGKGKKAVGINGDRSYGNLLSDKQLRWLEKDLSGVSPDAGVFICCHCPLLRTGRKDGILLPFEQVAKVDSLAAGFKNGITIFSGHIHLWDICDNRRFPHLFQYGLPATSGIMWETPVEWKLTSSDGSDSGVFYGTFAEGSTPEYHFRTFTGGENMYRIYDMNEVGKAYKASEAAQKQLGMFKGSRLYYGDRKYRNCVYINYWGYRPGDMVQLFENGKELPGEHNNFEDPVHNFAYDLQIITGDTPHHNPKGKDSCIHMYQFKTHGARTPLTLRISDKDGNVRYEQNIARPVAFDPSGSIQ